MSRMTLISQVTDLMNKEKLSDEEVIEFLLSGALSRLLASGAEKSQMKEMICEIIDIKWDEFIEMLKENKEKIEELLKVK